MSIRLGDEAPNFTAETTEGTIDFHQWKNGNWAVLFSHPADFTPVCTTELGRTASLKERVRQAGREGRSRSRLTRSRATTAGRRTSRTWAAPT